ncbi:hypothetical protein SLEP1_g58547 [Rubroshorea leprosula]|uniref:Cytochrome c oxidase subunit 3 n=1 Tax=Rubroshorea leprosula TaxID=152421 RepID=A0AAV5MQN6_9ROSI|nr:hypothetical protein SLEP1_g58547 [Rubroshorea leprosula]
MEFSGSEPQTDLQFALLVCASHHVMHVAISIVYGAGLLS